MFLSMLTWLISEGLLNISKGTSLRSLSFKVICSSLSHSRTNHQWPLSETYVTEIWKFNISFIIERVDTNPFKYNHAQLAGAQSFQLLENPINVLLIWWAAGWYVWNHNQTIRLRRLEITNMFDSWVGKWTTNNLPRNFMTYLGSSGKRVSI